MYAAENGHDAVVGVLLGVGADVEVKNNASVCAFVLLCCWTPLSSQDGSTTLMYASWKGHDAVVGVLLGVGADVEAKDNVSVCVFVLLCCWTPLSPHITS